MTVTSPAEPGNRPDELQALIEEARRRTRRRRRRNRAVITIAAAFAAGVYVLAAHPFAGTTQAKSRQSLAAAAAGCGVTTLARGTVPAWTAPAFSDSSFHTPPIRPPWPHALSEHGNVVAVVFGYPLRAGHPTNPANKVLWIMRLPRHFSPLRVRATPLHAKAPVVRASWPADSSPGEIYPSYLNVPTAGCWRVNLQWAGHTDSLDLLFTPGSRS